MACNENVAKSWPANLAHRVFGSDVVEQARLRFTSAAGWLAGSKLEVLYRWSAFAFATARQSSLLAALQAKTGAHDRT